MGPVPPEIHRVIAGISRRKAVQLVSLAGLASLVGCGSKDYELRHTSAEAMIHIAFAHQLLSDLLSF